MGEHKGSIRIIHSLMGGHVVNSDCSRLVPV